jgi:hypothetical protein
VAERLDEERLEILRAWGAGLETDNREELRAAGKAIMILIDEIERLHIDLWHAGEAGSPSDLDGDEFAEPVSSQELATSLRSRIRAAISPRGMTDRQP